MTALLLLFIALFALACSAFCSGAETGFLSMRRGRILHMVRAGSVRAKILSAAMADMGRTTAALLVANNVANVTYSSATAALVSLLGTDVPAFVPLLSFLSALVLLFLGEFLPKLFCAARPLRRMLRLAPVWNVLSPVFVPVGALLQRLAERFLPPREAKARITPETVLKILQDRKDGVRLSDFESALVGRIMVLRAKGELVTPDALLSALDDREDDS